MCAAISCIWSRAAPVAPTINHSVSALRFLFNVTLGRARSGCSIGPSPGAPEAPVVLSPEEVARFLEAAPGLKYKAALSVAYGAGLRASEVVSAEGR